MTKVKDTNLNKLLNCNTLRQCNICSAHDVDVFHDDNSQILSLIAYRSLNVFEYPKFHTFYLILDVLEILFDGI